MRNAGYCSSFPSPQLCSFAGNNEVVHQIPSSDFFVSNSSSSINGGSGITSSNSFFKDSQVYNDQHLGSFSPLSSIDIPSSSSLNYLHLPTTTPGSITSTNTTTATNFMNETTYQSNFTQIKRLLNPFAEAAPFDSDTLHKTRAEINRIDRAPPPVEESRKRKAICVDEHPRANHPIVEKPPLETQRLPVRRSQKISDKITALQKLVSPFGKTDTASVLQEASVYIKLLHEQIQMLSTPYFGAGSLIQQGVGGEQRSHDLRSRGLCLVPVSFTRNIIRQDVDQSISRRTTIPRHYY